MTDLCPTPGRHGAVRAPVVVRAPAARRPVRCPDGGPGPARTSPTASTSTGSSPPASSSGSARRRGRDAARRLARPPADASAASPAPLVVFVHGGPLGSWNMWHWRWNPHILVERGYAIVLPDPALSTGYGQQMLDRGWGQWGGTPYTDIMAVTDVAVARDDIDGATVGLMGGSYGGYMANWVAGHTDRFKAIVTHASLWELLGFHGTTDHGPAWEHEMGDPYEDPSGLPAQLAARVPGRDGRGEDADARHPRREGPPRPDLRGAHPVDGHAAPGHPGRFLYFPDENHWILKPQNARLWYGTVLSFLDEHLCGIPFQRDPLLGG